jgi:Lysine-specific metallo-endopeptidase
MVDAVSFGLSSPRATAANTDVLSGMLSDSLMAKATVRNAPSTAISAPGAIAARDMTKTSSRSLTTQEKQVVRTALENAKVRLERTELALQGNWLKRVPGSTSTNKEVFRQYFGNNTEGMRIEVLARVQRIRVKVDTMLSQNIGNSVVRATGQLSDYSAYVDRGGGTEKISIGDRFFSYRSPSSTKMNSQAGVFVHELAHVVQYNGKKSVDEVPAYVGSGKGVYEAEGLKKLAQNNPELAVRNNNLLMWYVERAK